MIQVEIKHPSDSLLEFVRHLQLENRRKIEELKNEVMRNDEILEGTNLIAEFMEYKVRCITDTSSFGGGHTVYLYSKDGITISQLPYDKDWNLLMEVVEKIQRIVIKDGHEVCIEFYEGLPNVKETYVTIDENIEVSHPDSKIAIWMAIVQFIKYQNVKES